MGLFSKILGNSGASLDKLVKNVTDAARANAQPGQQAPSAPQGGTFITPAAAPAAKSGLSWGPDMPAEENQFSYNGTPFAYFDHVFSSDFPGYQVVMENIGERHAAVFTFFKNGQKALVVELLRQSSGAYKLRRDCARAGVPYLRYYYDHHGWWNTRSYVTGRTRAALGF